MPLKSFSFIIAQSSFVSPRRSEKEPFTFPPDAAADKFLADVPEGVRSYTEVAGEYQTGYANGTSYLDPSWTQEVNVWGAWDGSKTSGGILYIKGFQYWNISIFNNTVF